MNRFLGVVTPAAVGVLFLTSVANALEVGPQYGFQSLGLSPSGVGWQARAISDVGVGSELVIVGGDGTSSFGNAIRWTESNGTEHLFAPQFGGIANDVSADGSVIVGVDLEAFRWTEAGGVEYLGVLPGGGIFSEAHAVTRDGSVTVGRSDAGVNGSGFRLGQAFRTDSSNAIQPLGTVVSNPPNVGMNNWGALDAVRDGNGNLWSVGASNLSGGANGGVIWKNDDIIHIEPDGFQGNTLIPAVGIIPADESNNETLVMPVQGSFGGSAGEVGFRIFTIDVTTGSIFDQGVAQAPPLGVLDFGYVANDVSSNGSVIVGSAIIVGEDNGTVGGRDGARNEPYIWEVGRSIWGSSGNDIPINLYALLQDNLPASQQASLMFDDWALNTATGVTVGEVDAPSLGLPVLTSVIVGNGIDPNGVRLPWTATVRNAPGLELAALSQRDLFSGGDFTGNGSEWTESGDGSFEVILNPVGEGTVGRLTTDTEFSISQLVETPDSPFVIAFDMLFTTDVGSFQIGLDGELLEEIFAPSLPGSEWVTVPVLVADPALLGRTNIPLTLTAFGGSTGQILIDNVAIASVPEPNSCALLLLGFVFVYSARRYKNS